MPHLRQFLPTPCTSAGARVPPPPVRDRVLTQLHVSLQRVFSF